MKKFLTSVCGGAALLALLAGCDPSMAQRRGGTQEELWYRQLKDNYTSFRPPQYPAPAVTRPVRQAAAPAASVTVPDDAEKAVDRAAAGEEVTPVKQESAKPADAEKGKVSEPKESKAPEAKDAAKEQKADPAANTVQSEKFHVVKSGDTLGSIARKYYGRASMEDVIFDANTKVIKNRNRLSIGMRLVIPEL